MVRAVYLTAVAATALALTASVTTEATADVWPQSCKKGGRIKAGAGVVLLHGTRGWPQGYVRGLAAKGVVVESPEMPWSFNRIYDRSFDEAMSEIDRAVARLKNRGATWFVIAGHSLGANAALCYGATRGNVKGVVMLAAGGSADMMVRFIAPVRSSVARARSLMAEGRGGERATFAGSRFPVVTTASVYLSYLDPAGPAVIRRNAGSLHRGTAVLWVFGSRDRLKATNRRAYAFNRLPPHALHAYATIDAGHLDTPDRARHVVADWLACL